MNDFSADMSAFAADVKSSVRRAADQLVDRILDELGLGGPRQHTRLLRLHTTLGPNVLVAERADITESIGPDAGAGDKIELLALSTRDDLNPSDQLGQPVLLELLTSQSRTSLRPFHGHITGFELLGSDGALSRYRLTIEPWTAFLRHRVDAWLFQNKNVLQIVAEVFADYAGQGRVSAAYRFDVADESVYPVLSTLSQYNESDSQLVSRLLSDNGLFTWFEHKGNPGDLTTLGSHTLVIADHNGAIKPGAQERIRFTQTSAAMKEDSLTQWHGCRRVGASRVNTASWDYRGVGNHSASDQADAGHAQPMDFVYTDQPGAYAFETPAEAQRLARVQMQSLAAQRKQFEGLATVRTLAPATSFVLLDHAEHDQDRVSGGDEAARFAVLSVRHRVRNNLSADAQAGLQHLLGRGLLSHDRPEQPMANTSDEPVYQARVRAQRAHVSVRPQQTDANGAKLHRRPQVWGTQTAVVVGLDEPVHTDRDGRIKVQFHWQRGANSSHRLSHSSPTQDVDNAPASDASGTWARVSQRAAGANWGSVFIPRLGQEVLVTFIDGDIDRPLVVGSAYNGQGSENAQGNTVSSGAALATGNAPAWFPGSEAGHAHTATLSGFKSQSLEASQTGMSGHNQLVFDDTPGQGRLHLHTTHSQTWLQMGHLLQQHDNQRLSPRGHGLELHTQAQGAIRAGSGLHLSAHARQGGTSRTQGQPTNSKEAQSQLSAHAELLQTLADNSQTHLAQLPSEPAAAQLKARKALGAALTSLSGTQGRQCGSGDEVSGEGEFVSMEGGHGTISVTDRPDLVVSAPGDIASLTPAHTVISAGQHTTITAGQDINLNSQRHLAMAVKDGISLFTRGEAKDSQRAVQDVGLKMHAASGNVNVQAQSAQFKLTAELSIDIQSTGGSVVISAPNKLLINGGGSYIKIEGSGIEVGTSGTASFKGGMKELAGGASAGGVAPALNKAQDLFDEQFVLKDQLTSVPLASTPYRIENTKGEVVATGVTDEQGQTIRVTSSKAEKLKIHWGH